MKTTILRASFLLTSTIVAVLLGCWGWLWQTYFPEANLVGLLWFDPPVLAKTVMVGCLVLTVLGVVLAFGKQVGAASLVAALGIILGLAGAGLDQLMIQTAMREANVSSLYVTAPAHAGSILLAASGLLVAMVSFATLLVRMSLNGRLSRTPSETI